VQVASAHGGGRHFDDHVLRVGDIPHDALLDDDFARALKRRCKHRALGIQLHL
jgi:hypothetical protein